MTKRYSGDFIEKYKKQFDDRVGYYESKGADKAECQQRATVDVMLSYCRENREPPNAESLGYIEDILADY